MKARQISLDGKANNGIKLTMDDFKKMSPAELLVSDDPRAIEVLRHLIMRRNTTVRFLSQELTDMFKNKKAQILQELEADRLLREE